MGWTDWRVYFGTMAEIGSESVGERERERDFAWAWGVAVREALWWL
jgi:hypothetical protein